MTREEFHQMLEANGIVFVGDAAWRVAQLVAAAERETCANELRRQHAEIKDQMRAELREATEAVNDPAVNNLRTLPESIRLLRAKNDALLEALNRAVDIIDRVGDTPRELICRRVWLGMKCEEALTQARAAIAKSAGETQ